MQQPDLTAAAAAPKGADPFAAARAAHPEDRLLLVIDMRDESRTMIACARGSAWYELLPPEQVVCVRAVGAEKAAA